MHFLKIPKVTLLRVTQIATLLKISVKNTIGIIPNTFHDFQKNSKGTLLKTTNTIFVPDHYLKSNSTLGARDSKKCKKYFNNRLVLASE